MLFCLIFVYVVESILIGGAARNVKININYDGDSLPWGMGHYFILSGQILLCVWR